ncbi:hypothetical protein PTTG_30578 [Puccinia triticina 1-1 BBBD Race 1]|uniref:Uncharacterized protein n=1 Tax=Puccinia triticina (isolate 1-1 / race 1 (BBBD)) TaxID=630390 RepID=A0A180FY76_PUCT1|nr:hypothetical protein PTTG_30578 [Puccinia triticina 1-1 BBBD Race 1]
MSGLNIQDTTNSVKAAAQQAAPVADEGSQTAQPSTQSQEPDADANPQGVLSQTTGPAPKLAKAVKVVKSKVTTRASAKKPPAAPRSEPAQEGNPGGPLRDPEIAKILDPASGPNAVQSNPLTVEDKKMSDAEVNREAQSILMAKMIKAKRIGDNAKVERYMKMYKAVLADRKTGKPKVAIPSVNPKVAIPSVSPPLFQTPTVPQKRPAEAGKTTQVQTVKFIAGRSNSHDDGGFPPYFHKLLLKCEGPLPLTIFDREWQERALAKHSKNRPKIEETTAEKGL